MANYSEQLIIKIFTQLCAFTQCKLTQLRKNFNHHYLTLIRHAFMLWIVIVILPTVLFAGGVDNLLKYASPDNTLYNVNKPEVITDQSGGFITGGSILMRGPRPMELQPFHVTMPNFKYDPCSGSGDFRFGAFSYISGEEFVRFFKGIPRASGAYATKLLLKTVCPQCEDVISQFESIVRDINNLNMNQCSMSQSIVDGAFSKVLNTGKLSCMVRSNKGNRNPDLFASQKACQDNPEVYNGTAEEEIKSLLGDQFNLTWKALTNSGTEIKDKELLELMMSIVGTVIGKKENGKMRYTRKPSLFEDERQIESYIGSTNGGMINVYTCDETTNCLNPTVRDFKLDPHQTFYTQINKIMNDITQKVASNSPTFTTEERDIISFSSMPLITMVEQDLILKGNKANATVSNSELVEVVSYDVVVGFLDSLLNKVDKEVKALEIAQMDRAIFDSFKDDIARVKQGFFNKKMTAFNRANIVMQAKEHMKLQQASIKNRFSRILSDNWGK